MRAAALVDIYGDVYRTAGPLATMTFLPVLVAVISAAAVGLYTTEALAGVGVAAAIYAVVGAVGSGLGAFQQIIASRYVGMDNHRGLADETLRLVRATLPWTAGLAVVMIAIGLGMRRWWDDPSAAPAAEYLITRGPSIVPQVIVTLLVTAMFAAGHRRALLNCLLITAGVNVPLSFALVFGFGPVPGSGALGDGVAATVATLAPLLYLGRRYRSFRHGSAPTPAGFPAQYEARFPGQSYRRWLSMSMPLSVSNLLDYAATLLMTLMVAGYAAADLAGMRVAQNLQLAYFAIISGVSVAVVIELNKRPHITGAGRAAVRRVLHRSLLPATLAAGATVVVGAGAFAALGTNDPEVAHALLIYGAMLLACCAPCAWCYRNVALLRLAGHTRSEMLSNMIAVWCVQVPLGWAGGLALGGPGVVAGFFFYWLARAVLTQWQTRTARSSPMAQTHEDAAGDERETCGNATPFSHE